MINKKLMEKRISVDPRIQHGRPCVRKTRIPVHIILEALATRMDVKTIKKEFAPITTEDIQACIMYGAILADEQEFIYQPI